MKKLFGGVNLTWKIVIISAIVIGISVGLLNSVPALRDTTITDIATYFDFWIFFGLFIVMNSKSNMDSALKCFVFFLISQPLIYLAEVPFNSLGWGLFVYYRNWFIWTILTIPMGYIGYYIKKDKWYSFLILIPLLILLGGGINTTITNFKYSFPKHTINLLFIIASFIMYPILLFNDKKIKYIGLIISITIMIIFGFGPAVSSSTYDTTVKCSDDNIVFDNTYKAYLEDDNFGSLSISYNKNIEEYCIDASFKKQGDTRVVLEDSNGNKQYYDLSIGKNTFSIKGLE